MNEHTEQQARLGPGAVTLLIALAVLAIGIAFTVLISVTGPKPPTKPDAVKPPAVEIAEVTERVSRIAITSQGEVRPRIESQLSAQVGGRVVWTNPAFIEGGAFAAGETLVRIESADYELAVVRASAQVAQARQELTREEAEGDLARRDWEMLGQGGEASPLTLREPQLAQAKASLAAAEAQLQGAQLDLERTQVRAPFAGRIRARAAQVGDVVGQGAPVADIFSTDVAEVRVPLTDAQLAYLDLPLGFAASRATPAPQVRLSATVAGVEREWSGRLVRLDAAIDPRTRQVFGVVEAREPFSSRYDAPLAPGLFVTAQIESAREETLFVAPRETLKKNEFLYVLRKDDTIDIRRVAPVQTTASEAFFRENVAAGERLVVSALPSARQGMAVTPLKTSTSAKSAPAQAPPT